MADDSDPAVAPRHRYYTTHAEDSWASAASVYADGYTLYHGLARQVIGDPSKFEAIRDAISHFHIRARSNPDHPLYKEVLRREAEFLHNTGFNLSTFLNCPDMGPAHKHVLWVIANALNIEIRIYTSISDGRVGHLRGASGKAQPNGSHALLEQPTKRGPMVRYSSLLPDESGRDSFEYLQATKARMEAQAALPVSEQTYGGLLLKQVSYAWKENDRAGLAVSCFNEFRDDSKKEHLNPGKAESRMDTFEAVIDDAEHIKPALEVFHEVLKRAPNQRRNVKVSSDYKSGEMLPHCAADGEFVKLPRDLAKGHSRDKLKRMVDEGELEELCSVLTIAVGRNFALVVNVVHLLETANEHTVPALEMLFKQTIFDSRLMKLWWNLQHDFFVLDNTIAHMYQATARAPFKHTPWQQSPRMITPKFRIRSAHLNGVRPQDMQFPRGEWSCELHEPGTNALNMSCTCQLGNIDISPLLNHFARSHGFDEPKMDWTANRYRFKYDDLIRAMLGSDRLLPILNYMKERASQSPSGSEEFYQNLGKPSMKQDDDALGYVVMDVYSLNIIFEQLFARWDAHFVAGQIYSWASNNRSVPQSVEMKSPLSQRRHPSFKSAGDIPLFEDNPKRFQRDAFWPDYSKLPDCGRGPMDAVLTATKNLPPWQHDERAKTSLSLHAAEAKLTRPRRHSTHTSLTEEHRGLVEKRKAELLERTMDPLSLWLPTTCAQIFEDQHPAPVVRAGITHSEALIKFLQSPHCKNASPPPGFGVRALPPFVNRLAGLDMKRGREIFDAFQIDTRGVRRASRDRRPAMDKRPDYAALAQEKLAKKQEKVKKRNAKEQQDMHELNVWKIRDEVMDDLAKQIHAEHELNQDYGLPGLILATDLFDYEGREYRCNVEATPEWNRPEMLGVPVLGPNEDWRSEATETLKALEKMTDDQGGADEWKKVGRGGKARGWESDWEW